MQRVDVPTGSAVAYLVSGSRERAVVPLRRLLDSSPDVP